MDLVAYRQEEVQALIKDLQALLFGEEWLERAEAEKRKNEEIAELNSQMQARIAELNLLKDTWAGYIPSALAIQITVRIEELKSGRFENNNRKEL